MERTTLSAPRLLEVCLFLFTVPDNIPYVSQQERSSVIWTVTRLEPALQKTTREESKRVVRCFGGVVDCL